MKNRIFSLLTAVTFFLTLLPAPALAGQAGAEAPMLLSENNVPYLDCDGDGRNWAQETCASPTVVDPGATTWDAGWYVVSGNVSISNRVTVNGEVRLILEDGCNLNANKGIEVSNGNSLYIYAQSTGSNMGKLTAKGQWEQTGIGSQNPNNGKITINGGMIHVTGGENTAAIGGGGGGSSPGTITINGGHVYAMGNNGSTASGADGGAGIGGGSYRAAGAISINGGYVEAYGCNGAGIGGGYCGSSGAITITGGTVIAKAYGEGDGIGGGAGSDADSITISGDNTVVIASSGNRGGIPLGAPNGSATRDGGLIIEGNTGKLYSASVTLSDSITIPVGATVTVDDGQTLIVPESVSLEMDGKIEGNGTVNIADNNAVTVQVTYNYNGAPLDEVKKKDTYKGTYDLPQAAPTWVGHMFLGWFTAKTGGTKVSGESTVDILGGHTLYARWQEKPSQVTVTLSAAEVTYGDSLTIAATAAAKAVNSLLTSWTAEQDKVQFFVNDNLICTSDFTIQNAAATAELTISNVAAWDNYKEKFRAGDNTIRAEFGTLSGLDILGGTGTASLTVKNRERTIPAPEAEKVTSATVTLKTVAASPSMQDDQILYGYSTTEEASQTRWQRSYEFTDLLPDTTYYFYAKVDANDREYYAEAISQPVPVTTSKALGAFPTEGLCLNTGSISVRKGAGDTLLVTQGEKVYLLDKDMPIRVTGNGTMTPNTITVTGAEAHIILDGVKQGGSGWITPIAIEPHWDTGTPSDVTLTLQGENVLAASDECEQGIFVQRDSTLTIDGPGSLKIGNENTRVGIGIGGGFEFGNVVINGGTVDITAQRVAIGAEMMMIYGEESIPTITINGGVVKTNVLDGRGVGIGTQRAHEGGVAITVTGGSVELSGNGNKISASGDMPFPEEIPAPGSVTITGGSITSEPVPDTPEAKVISPTPTDGRGNELVPVVIDTKKLNTPVDALGLDGISYGAPAKTDGNGNLTLYLPKPESEEETQYTGLVIINGEIHTVAASALQDGSGEGAVEDTGVHVETPENTKPEIKSDGSIVLPGNSTVTKGDTSIDVPPQGGVITSDGTVKKLFTVTFNSQKGSAVSSQTVAEGGKAAKPDDPTRTGYTFAGWYTDAACTTAWSFDTTVNASMTLYAKWTVRQDPPAPVIRCTVTFDSQGGSAVSSQTVTEGGKAVKPANPTRNGYIFCGWYTDAACTTAWNFDSDTVSVNLILYAKWTVRPSDDSSSGGGSSDTPTYPPSVEKPGEGGSVTVVPGRPSAGDKVTIQPKPDAGYEVDQITVTDRNGKLVAVAKETDGTYTFTQPSGKVKIEVSYQPVEAHWNNPHGDVSKTAWYYDAVRFVSVNGLMSGYDDGRFAPDDNLSRAQCAQILYSHAGRPAAPGSQAFTDVTSDAWYSSAITWAAAQGVVGGYGNGLFGPNDSITREQLAVMLWRYAGSPAATDKELRFADVDKAGDYALEALRWAVENGILNGYGDGRLDPTGLANRAQAAAMLMQYVKETEE